MVFNMIKNRFDSTTPYTTGDNFAYDVNKVTPPSNTKIVAISKYGVARIGMYIPGFDIAWSPLPKIPESCKNEMV